MNDQKSRALWVVIILLVSLLLATFAALALRAAGTDVPGSLLAAGTTFFGVAALGVAIQRVFIDG